MASEPTIHVKVSDKPIREAIKTLMLHAQTDILHLVDELEREMIKPNTHQPSFTHFISSHQRAAWALRDGVNGYFVKAIAAIDDEGEGEE